MKKSILCMAFAFCLAFTLLLSSEPVEGAITDSASPYTYPAKYSGNPVKDAGDTIIDVSKTKFGALPGNNAIDSKSVLYKGYYYVLDGGAITQIPLKATDGTKFKILYSAGAIDFGLSNLQIANDYLFWEERSWSGANTVRIRRMKIDGTKPTTIANYEDKFTIYNGKIYVRDANTDSGEAVQIVSYNLDGSGRKVVFTPPSGKELALVPTENGTKKLLEYSGGYGPFGFSGDKLYYVQQDSSYNAKPPELWRMNLDGSKKELVRMIPVDGNVGYRMIHQKYLYYTYRNNTYRIPFSDGKAQQVLPDTESFNLFGNKMFLARIIPAQYISNPNPGSVVEYPSSTVFVADLDGKNMRQLFSTDYYPTTVNIISPDYLYAEAHETRGTFFSINPKMNTDISLPLGKLDTKKNKVIDPMKVSVKSMKFAKKGHIADGWYYLRCMYNYLSINAEGKAEFNDAKPYQKFKFTYKGGGTYRIETASGKVLNLNAPADIKNGSRLIAQNTTPFDWLLASESDGLFSLRPYINSGVLMNASERKKSNGTHIIVWSSPDAPENARWRLIPVSTAQALVSD